MKFEDLVALAKAGYKVAEIKELLNMEPTAVTDTDPTQSDTQIDKEAEANEPVSSNTTQTEEDSDQIEETVDYRALYEESQKKLAQAQASNLHKEIINNDKSDEDVLKEICSTFI